MTQSPDTTHPHDAPAESRLREAVTPSYWDMAFAVKWWATANEVRKPLEQLTLPQKIALIEAHLANERAGWDRVYAECDLSRIKNDEQREGLRAAMYKLTTKGFWEHVEARASEKGGAA